MYSIIIPTYNHQDTIRYAIESVLYQSYQNFEIFVVSDGAPERTKELVNELMLQDNRIHYFDNPKGEGNGEQHRAQALKQARGKYVAYLGDDDIWLPNHLELFLPYLNGYDFVQTAQASLSDKESWHVYANDLCYEPTRQKMLEQKFNFFGPSVVAHRLDSYHKLPQGWRPKPDGLWSDLYMWRQWIEQPWVRYKSLPQVTVLHLASPHRTHMSIHERCIEMRYWLNEIRNGDIQKLVREKQLQNWHQQLTAETQKVSLVELVHQLHADHQLEALIPIARLILSREAHHHGIRELLISALINTNNYVDAENEIATALAAYPNNALYPIRKANVALKQGNLELATQATKKAIELNAQAFEELSNKNHDNIAALSNITTELNETKP